MAIMHTVSSVSALYGVVCVLVSCAGLRSPSPPLLLSVAARYQICGELVADPSWHEAKMRVSEQTQLLACGIRMAEMLSGKSELARVEPQLLAGHLETAADHPGVRTASFHALTPCGVVVLAAARVTDELEHVPIAVGVVLNQPFAEQISYLERQTQEHVACLLHAGRGDRVEDSLDLAVVECRNHRRYHRRGRHANLCEPAQRFQPPHRRRCARLHLAG